MDYNVEFRPAAVNDLEQLSRDVAQRVLGKIEYARHGLAGDVKRLTNSTPEYRLRVADWRVLFEISGNRMIVYRILHRSKAYE